MRRFATACLEKVDAVPIVLKTKGLPQNDEDYTTFMHFDLGFL